MWLIDLSRNIGILTIGILHQITGRVSSSARLFSQILPWETDGVAPGTTSHTGHNNLHKNTILNVGSMHGCNHRCSDREYRLYSQKSDSMSAPLMLVFVLVFKVVQMLVRVWVDVRFCW